MLGKAAMVALLAIFSTVDPELVNFNHIRGPLVNIKSYMTFYGVYKVYQCAELCYLRRDCVSFSYNYLRVCILSMETWPHGGKLYHSKYNPKQFFYGEKKDIPSSMIKNGCANHTCAGGTFCVGQGVNKYMCIPEVPCADQHPWCKASMEQFRNGQCINPNISYEKNFAVVFKCNKFCKWC